MGKIFSVETKPISLEDIYSLKEEEINTTLNNNKELATNYQSKFLRVWRIFENNTPINKSNKKSKSISDLLYNKINCEAISLMKANKEDLILKPENSFIILLSQAVSQNNNSNNNDNKLILTNNNNSNFNLNIDEQISSSRSNFTLAEYKYNEDSEFISNITKRGLEYIFSSDISNEISDNNNNNNISDINTKYKYSVYLWNGLKSPESVRSSALLNAHKLSKVLLNNNLVKLLCINSNTSQFLLPSDLIKEETTDRNEKEKDNDMMNLKHTISKDYAIPSPNKRKKRDKYKNFKNTFIVLNLKEDLTSKPNSMENRIFNNSSNRENNSNIHIKEEIEKESPLFSLKEKYYKLFDANINKKEARIQRKNNSSRKKSSKYDKTYELFDNDDADNEEIDDLENDIIIPSNNNMKNFKYNNLNYNSNKKEGSTTAISNLSLKLDIKNTNKNYIGDNERNDHYKYKNEDEISNNPKINEDIENQDDENKKDNENNDEREDKEINNNNNNTNNNSNTDKFKIQIKKTSNTQINKLNLGSLEGLKKQGLVDNAAFTFNKKDEITSKSNSTTTNNELDSKDNNNNMSKTINDKETNNSVFKLNFNAFGNNNNLSNMSSINNQARLPGLNLKNMVFDKADDMESEKCFKEFSQVCSEVIDNFLYLSGQDVANNQSILEENGITHIVNAAGEICDCSFPEITYLRLNLRDNSNENIESCFYESYKFIEEARKKNGRVLVHCVQGISRSTTIIISYLILTRKLNYENALKFVENRRKIVSPNLGFSLQAQAFYQRIYEGYQAMKYLPKVFCVGFISPTSSNLVCRFLTDRICQNPEKLLDKRGCYIISNSDITIFFIGEKVNPKHLSIFKSKAEEYFKYLLAYEKASPNTKLIYESELKEDSNLKNNTHDTNNEDLDILTDKATPLQLMNNVFKQSKNNIFTTINENWNYWFESKDHKSQTIPTSSLNTISISTMSSTLNNNNLSSNNPNISNNNYTSIASNKLNLNINTNIDKDKEIIDIKTNHYNNATSRQMGVNLSFKPNLKESLDEIYNLPSERRVSNKRNNKDNDIQEVDENENKNEIKRKRILVYPETESSTFLDIEDFDQNEMIVILVEYEEQNKMYIWKNTENLDEDEVDEYLIQVKDKFFGCDSDYVDEIVETPYEESEEFLSLF